MKKLMLAGLLIIPFIAPAQIRFVFDTIFSNKTCKDFFLRNTDVDSVEFTNISDASSWVNVYQKATLQNDTTSKRTDKGFKHFNTKFTGDNYLLAKEYGKLSLPEKELAIVTSRSCFNHFRLCATLTVDLIKCHLTYECSSGNTTEDYEIVLSNSDRLPQYKGGIKQLENKMQRAYDSRYPFFSCAPSDSVLIFTFVVAPNDSCLHNIELIEGNQSMFQQLVMDELKRSCAWLPAILSSRTVLAYTSIFIRLNNDGSLTMENKNW